MNQFSSDTRSLARQGFEIALGLTTWIGVAAMAFGLASWLGPMLTGPVIARCIARLAG
jgi:hypothetical protein